MIGWIALHRQITEWRWYTDGNTFRLFVHLLLKANSKPGEWRGFKVLPGQLITGRKALAEELGLTEQEIRTSLKKLKNSKEITSKSTNKFSIITVCKWWDYQHYKNDDQPTNKPTNQPATNQQLTTNNNVTIKQVNKRAKDKSLQPLER